MSDDFTEIRRKAEPILAEISAIVHRGKVRGDRAKYLVLGPEEMLQLGAELTAQRYGGINGLLRPTKFMDLDVLTISRPGIQLGYHPDQAAMLSYYNRESEDEETRLANRVAELGGQIAEREQFLKELEKLIILTAAGKKGGEGEGDN